MISFFIKRNPSTVYAHSMGKCSRVFHKISARQAWEPCSCTARPLTPYSAPRCSTSLMRSGSGLSTKRWTSKASEARAIFAEVCEYGPGLARFQRPVTSMFYLKFAVVG